MPVFDEADAYFLTWTTYGTWLPGDPRGHASNFVGADRRYQRESREFGADHSPGDPVTLKRALAEQKWDTVWLDSRLARGCAAALIESVIERNWTIVRSAIMPNHVHVVLRGSTLTGGMTRRILKGVSQARLSDAVGKDQRWWTRGGSNPLLRGSNAILAAMRYVENQQGILIRIANNQIVAEWPVIVDP